MKYPQILFLPLLMFSDYFLTVLGAVLKERRYNQHFKAEHYELNPVWQKSIAQKKWFNLRHFLLTILISVVLGCALEFSDFPNFLAEGLFGMLFVFFGTVIGRHLSNILIFRLVAKAPGELTGQITMGHSLSLAISRYQYLVVAVPMVITAIFSPTPFTIGGIFGALMIFSVHSLWIYKHRKKTSGQERRSEAAR